MHGKKIGLDMGSRCIDSRARRLRGTLDVFAGWLAIHCGRLSVGFEGAARLGRRSSPTFSSHEEDANRAQTVPCFYL